MYRRPESVTVVGWVLSVFGFIAILRTLFSFSTEDGPVHGHALNADIGLAVGGLGAVIMFVSGVNILSGQNWARWLYTIMCGALLIADVILLTDKLYIMVPATVMRFVCIICLFMPEANRFFLPRRRRDHW